MGNKERYRLLKSHFEHEGVSDFTIADELQIVDFENYNHVMMPPDFKQYLIGVNRSGNAPLDSLYEFYGINRIRRIADEYKDWTGIPDYQHLDFEKFKDIFIFGNYEFNLYSFGIELFDTPSSVNRVYIFCGKKYEVIAGNFNDFTDQYLHDPLALFI